MPELSSIVITHRFGSTTCPTSSEAISSDLKEGRAIESWCGLTGRQQKFGRFIKRRGGGSDLNFVDSAKIIEQCAAASEVAVALEWYGEGAVAFRWSLGGSSRAIKASCPQRSGRCGRRQGPRSVSWCAHHPTHSRDRSPAANSRYPPRIKNRAFFMNRRTCARTSLSWSPIPHRPPPAP